MVQSPSEAPSNSSSNPGVARDGRRRHDAVADPTGLAYANGQVTIRDNIDADLIRAPDPVCGLTMCAGKEVNNFPLAGPDETRKTLFRKRHELADREPVRLRQIARLLHCLSRSHAW